jgi:hypothetical protein
VVLVVTLLVAAFAAPIPDGKKAAAAPIPQIAAAFVILFADIHKLLHLQVSLLVFGYECIEEYLAGRILRAG